MTTIKIHAFYVRKNSILTDLVPKKPNFRSLTFLLSTGHGQIIMYNSKSVICASFVVPHSYSLSCMSFHKKDASLLGAASKEGIVAIWNTENGNTMLVKQCHNSVVSDVAFHPGCKNVFASVGLDRKLICNDLRVPELVKTEYLDNELSAVGFMENR